MAKYTQQIKDRALGLYMQEHGAPTIASMLSKEFNIVCNFPVIYKWIKRYGWDAKRLEAKSKALVKVSEEQSKTLAERTKEQLDAYRTVWKSGEKFLDAHKDNPFEMQFDKTIDAAKAVDIGVQGERKVMSGLIAQDFADMIFSIVAEEVADAEILKKIAIKLRKLAVEVSK